MNVIDTSNTKKSLTEYLTYLESHSNDHCLWVNPDNPEMDWVVVSYEDQVEDYVYVGTLNSLDLDYHLQDLFNVVVYDQDEPEVKGEFEETLSLYNGDLNSLYQDYTNYKLDEDLEHRLNQRCEFLKTTWLNQDIDRLINVLISDLIADHREKVA